MQLDSKAKRNAIMVAILHIVDETVALWTKLKLGPDWRLNSKAGDVTFIIMG